MINKLCNYLKSIGVVELEKHAKSNGAPVECYRVQYGDNYFYNAPNFSYTGVLICFDYNVDAEPEYFKNLARVEDKIRKYARRYGYEVFNSTVCPWMRSFVIASRDDREKSATFYYYRDAAIEAVNQAIHNGYISGSPVSDADIKEIMNEYGNYYNERLSA